MDNVKADGYLLGDREKFKQMVLLLFIYVLPGTHTHLYTDSNHMMDHYRVHCINTNMFLNLDGKT